MGRYDVVMNEVLEYIGRFKRTNYIYYDKKMANYLDVKIIVEEAFRFDANKVGWTDFNGNIHVMKDHVENYMDNKRDTFIFQIVAHEMVHMKQYETLFGKFFARSIGRFWAEKQAKKIGEDAEKWILDNIVNRR